MQIAHATDIGLMRSTNQDAFAAHTFSDDAAFVIVCDGMGGTAAGHIASSSAVKIISESVISNFKADISSNSIKSLLQSAIIAANISIYDMQTSVKDLKGMGTTVVACLISGNVAHIMHAGDSRAIIFNKDLTYNQITTDHSIVQTMVESGELTENEARAHPRKNIITRALGVNETIELDYNEIDLKNDDTLMLATDGLTNFVDYEKIKEIFNGNKFMQIPQALVNIANKNGGGDNITTVIVKHQTKEQNNDNR